MIHHAFYDSPLGLIQIGHENGAVVAIRRAKNDPCEHVPCLVADLAAAQLAEYFRGERQTFSFLMAPVGTSFQRAVWDALSQIPYGQTRTYGQIAEAIGNPKACRAVGMACNRNPIWIAIPCHRVVGNNAALTGYAGGLDMKRALLELEKKHQ